MMNIYIFLSSFEVSLEIKKSLASQDRNVIRVKKKGGGGEQMVQDGFS